MAIEVSDILVDEFGDFVADGNGGLKIADSTQATKQVCIFRLKTAADDFAPDPDIGANIEGGIGSSNLKVNRDEMESKIRLSFVRDGFLDESSFFVRIIPVSATSVVVVIFVNSRPGFDLDEFTITFTYDYITGNIQMLDEL